MRGVALGGFMGVGKSAVGRRLAEALGLPFADLDVELTARHGAIREQFERESEAVFRRRERGLIAEFCDGTPRVLATGGGAWVDPVNRAALGGQYALVVLTATARTLERRLQGDVERPLWDAGAEARMRSRADAYADADLCVATDDRTPGEVAEAVLEGLRGRLGSDPSAVLVPLGRRSYEVVIRDDWTGLAAHLESLGLPERIAVADPAARALHGAALERELGPLQWIELEGGEAHKTPEALVGLLDELLEPGFHRGTALLAFGGGVTGDLVGLAAALAMRGVPWVQLPTTLLAMVDSSVGGKTAVNARAGKNLIGAFDQPRLVWAALQALDTLPARERACGLGEVLKTAVVGDAKLLDLLEREAEALGEGRAPRALVASVVRRCVEIKAEIVAGDERESGRRAVLNAGHTVAHGIEAALGGERIAHGEAVAIGLVAEARWALAHGHCEDPQLPERIAEIAQALGLPTRLPVTDRDAVTRAMRLDKKASSDSVRLPVPVRAGVVSLAKLPIDAIGELLDEA